MIGTLKDRVTVQTLTKTDTAMGVRRQWNDSKKVWGRLIVKSIEGTARYEQAGYSKVTHDLLLRGLAIVGLNMPDFRFKIRGLTYEPVEPPKNYDGLNEYVKIALRWVKEEDDRYPREPEEDENAES